MNERMAKEVERFKAQKLIDLKKMTVEYVERQIEYSRKMEVAYTALLPSLQAIKLESLPSNNPFDDTKRNGVPPPLPEKKYADPSL